MTRQNYSIVNVFRYVSARSARSMRIRCIRLVRWLEFIKSRVATMKQSRLQCGVMKYASVCLAMSIQIPLVCLNNLAGLYKEQGRYDEATPLYLKSLEVSKRTLGEEHPDTLLIMHNLGGLYQVEEDYFEAKSLFQQCFEIRKRRFGGQHPSTLDSMRALAGNYFYQGLYSQAEKLFQRCYEISKNCHRCNPSKHHRDSK